MLTNNIMYYKTFTLGAHKYTVTMKENMDNKLFMDLVFYVRRLMGYIIYPRWYVAHMFLQDTIWMLRKRGIYRHEVKAATQRLVKAMNTLEFMHTMDFDKEFVEVVAGHMSNVARAKVNELRGHIGGVLLNQNLKEYLFYSYPETFLVLAADNVRCWRQVLDEVNERDGIDFADVYAALKGDDVLKKGQLWLATIEKAVGEQIPYGIDARGTVAERTLSSLDKLMIEFEHMRRAFLEGFDEMPKDKRDSTKAFIEHLRSMGEEGERINQLKTKYKVTQL